MLKTPANFVLGSKQSSTYPITRKELSWQLGEGGWNLSRLRFLLVRGLFGRRFEHPHEDIRPSMNQLFGDWDELAYPRSETARVPALNVHESRPSEPADEPFA